MSEPWRFSVVILTLNEERNLPGCLASLAGCDDIVVLDSGSTDRTAEIARAAGARVLVHPFKDFADQRNHAHTAAGFRHDWVFHLDADELMTPELAAECNAVPANTPFDGYYSAPRMMSEGHWLKRCTDFPAWQARFVHVKNFRFVQVGHGQREAPGMRMGRLQGSYLHDITVHDLRDWEEKHRRYARAEAAAYLAQARPLPELLVTLVRGPMLARRRALKYLSYRLPGRSALRFFYQYWLRGGFRDGPPARGYCERMARYEGFTTEALREMQSAAKKHA
jgi:glycosyltransferase involved in cell wall biosynthesis